MAKNKVEQRLVSAAKLVEALPEFYGPEHGGRIFLSNYFE